MFSYEIGTSVVPFSYSGAPPVPGIFAIAKQAFKRGAVRAGLATLAFAGKHKLNVATWGVLAATVLGIAGYNTVTAPNTARKLAGIEAEMDKDAARINASITARIAQYEQTVRGFEPSFDFAAWNAKSAARQVSHSDVSVAVPVVVPDVAIAAVKLSLPVLSQSIIDAAHVKGLLGEHPLVARFANAQKTCPAVVANIQMDSMCQHIMNPLYRQLADEVAARTARDAKQVAIKLVEKKHVVSSAQDAGVNIAQRASVQRVSAPATKLLKIQQPRQDASNRPVRYAQGKSKPKAKGMVDAYRPDYATQFWQRYELNRG